MLNYYYLANIQFQKEKEHMIEGYKNTKEFGSCKEKNFDITSIKNKI